MEFVYFDKKKFGELIQRSDGGPEWLMEGVNPRATLQLKAVGVLALDVFGRETGREGILKAGWDEHGILGLACEGAARFAGTDPFVRLKSLLEAIEHADPGLKKAVKALGLNGNGL